MKFLAIWNRRSRRVISGGQWVHVVLLTLLMISTVTAQETVNSEEEEFVLQSGQVGRDQVLAIMASEVVLAPGVGLRNLRLGEPLADVQNRLGPPKRIERSGLLRNIIGLVYTLDSGTEIAVIGREVVERINVLGNSSQLVRTAQGARFGMQPSLILASTGSLQEARTIDSNTNTWVSTSIFRKARWPEWIFIRGKTSSPACRRDLLELVAGSIS